MSPFHHKDEEEHDEKSNDKKGLLYNIVGGILIAGCCWSLGFGYSQSTLSASVARVTMSIDHLRELQIADRKASEEADARIDRELSNHQTMSSEHMKMVVNLIQKMTEQNQELIAFLRANRGLNIPKSTSSSPSP
jgi:hypothetical protein